MKNYWTEKALLRKKALNNTLPSFIDFGTDNMAHVSYTQVSGCYLQASGVEIDLFDFKQLVR